VSTVPAYYAKLRAALAGIGYLTPGAPFRLTTTGSRRGFEHGIWESVVRDILTLVDSRHGQRGVRHSHGDAIGMDRLCGRVGAELGFQVVDYSVRPRDFAIWGAAAPLHRDEFMISTEMPDLVVALFAVLPSNGTAHTAGFAQERGIPVVRVTYEDLLVHVPVTW